MRPTIALRISVAAISRSSVLLASLYQAACGVQIRLGASVSGGGPPKVRRLVCKLKNSKYYKEVIPSPTHLPWLALKGSLSWTSNAAALIRPSFSAEARAFSSTRPPRAVLTRKAPTFAKRRGVSQQ